jgi:hypothetical protein
MSLATGAGIAPRNDGDQPRIFANFGLHSSGSTWMFNLARQICRTQGIDFVSMHRDSEANLQWDVFGSKLIVVRTNNPFPSFQSLIASSGEPAVITVREPRDAVVSFMQRFPTSLARNFDEALAAMVYSAQTMMGMMRLRKLPVFRYEDGFIGRAKTFDQIAALLGTRPSDLDRRAILAGLAPEAVKATISKLESTGAIQGEAVWDQATQWHTNHVGDGKIGKFREILSQAQQDQILAQMHEFCDCFEYTSE